MIDVFNLTIWQIVCCVYVIGVVCSYRAIRTVNRNANNGTNKRWGETKHYHYGHVFANVTLCWFSWVSFIIAVLIYLSDNRYRGKSKPPSWL